MKGKITLAILAICAVLALAIFVIPNLNAPDSTVIINSERERITQADLSHKQISWNGNALQDSTVFNGITNICTAQRLGFNVKVENCYADDADGKNIEQYVTFGWNGSTTKNVSLLFVYEGDIQKGSIELERNVTETTQDLTYVNDWVNNFLVDKVINYTSLGTPDDSCSIGNKNNTQMYRVNRADKSSYVYCFTNITTVNSTAFRISGNYNREIKTDRQVNVTKFVDVTNQIEPLGKNILGNGFSFYKTQSVTFAPGQQYKTRWVYTPENATKSGKWHILAYETEYGLINSIQDNRYLYLDPWWSSSWSAKRQITNLTGNIITLRFSKSDLSSAQADFDDLRFLNPSETAEYPYARIFYNTTTATYKIQTNGSTSLYLYYGNPGASYSGNIVGVYHPSVKGAWFFENPSNLGENTYDPSNNYTTVSGVGYIENRNSSYGTAQSTGASPQLLGNTIPEPSSAFTFMVFAKINNTSGTIINKGDISYTNKLIDRQTTNYRFVVGRGPSTNVETTLGSADSNLHFFVGTVQNSGNLDFYKDNSATTSSASLGGSMGASLTDVQLFTHDPSYAGAGSFMSGTIDDVIYLDAKINSSQVNYFAFQTAPYFTLGSEESQNVGINVSITLNSPANDTLSSTPNPVFNYTINGIGGANVTNATITIYQPYPTVFLTNTQAGSSNITNFVYTPTTNLSDGLAQKWIVYACVQNTTSYVCGNSSLYSYEVDQSAPNQTINAPTQNQIIDISSVPYNATLNVSVSDAHLSRCWYSINAGSTNVTYTCNNTLQNVTFASVGNKTIYAYANDTLGNLRTSTVNLLLNLVSYNVLYTSPISQQTNTTIRFNLNASLINVFSIILNYNNTNYSMSGTENATFANYSQVVTAPTVSSQTNIPFRFYYNLNGNNYTTANYTQTVNPLTPITLAQNCNDKALYFNIIDEQNFTNLNGTIEYNFRFGTNLNNSLQSVYGTLTNIHSFYLCINATSSLEYSIGYGELQYSSPGYVDRRYYLFEDTVVSNNTLSNITLYELLSDDQTSFIIEAVDTNLNKYTEKYTTLLRWYPSNNEYKIVDMGLTDENGQTVGHVQTEDVDYRVGLYYLNGSLIKLGEPVRFVCASAPCTFTLRSDAGDIDFTNYLNVESALTFNETTKIFSYVYNDPSQTTSGMRLSVKKLTGTGEIEICNNQSSGFTGIINCNVSAYTGTFKAVAYRSASPETPIAQMLKDITNSAFRGSTTGLIFSALIWLAIVLTGFSSASVSPLIILILGVVGLIPALIFGSITPIIFTGIIVIVAIVIHFIKRALAR
jgi:hypothetical protein